MSRLLSNELIQDKVDNAKRIANEHYQNYQFFYSRINLPKASEFLWGVINQLFYAIGLYHDKKLSTHPKIRKFIPLLIHFYDDAEIVEEGFESAFVLHSNFYHDHLEKDSFDFHKDKADKLIQKLLEILEKLSSSERASA